MTGPASGPVVRLWTGQLNVAESALFQVIVS